MALLLPRVRKRCRPALPEKAKQERKKKK